MTATSVKSHIGKEDLEIQKNVSAAETFERLTSTGAEITLTKVPDLWDGTGQIIVGKMIVKASDNNDTILHSFGGIT